MALPSTLPRISRRVALVVIGLLVIASACGKSSSSGSSSSGTTTTEASTTTSLTSNAELCAARDQLKSSVDDLKNINVVKNGTAGIESAVTDVRNNLQAVKTAAHGQLSSQIKVFEANLTALETAVKSGGGGGTIATSAASVATSGSALL